MRKREMLSIFDRLPKSQKKKYQLVPNDIEVSQTYKSFSLTIVNTYSNLPTEAIIAGYTMHKPANLRFTPEELSEIMALHNSELIFINVSPEIAQEIDKQLELEVIEQRRKNKNQKKKPFKKTKRRNRGNGRRNRRNNSRRGIRKG